MKPLKKFGHDTTKLFQHTLKIAKKTPDVITTDALQGLESGIAKTMGGSKTIHRKDLGISKRQSYLCRFNF